MIPDYWLHMVILDSIVIFIPFLFSSNISTGIEYRSRQTILIGRSLSKLTLFFLIPGKN